MLSFGSQREGDDLNNLNEVAWKLVHFLCLDIMMFLGVQLCCY